MATLRPGEDMTHLMTIEDIEHMDAHIDAAARGDAREALWHLDQSLQVEGTLTPYQLWELVQLGDEAPGWMYSRWCADQAYRWMLHQEDQLPVDAVRQTMIVSYLRQAEEASANEVSFRELGTRIAASDWLCEQLAVYDYGGLTEFLARRASDGLVQRCDHVREWADARMGGFVLDDLHGAALRVRDLSTGASLDVLNIGALTDRELGTPVIGRVVPVDAAPGLMFESRPVTVDLQTAEDVAAASSHEDPAYWITAIGDARYDERLEYAFSCHGSTMYSSDIIPVSTAEEAAMDELEPPGRLVDLLEQGLDEFQANGVLVAEVALTAVAVAGDEAAEAVAPHVAAVITDGRVFGAMVKHCTGPEHATGWRVLADCSTEPARSRCAELERLSAA